MIAKVTNLVEKQGAKGMYLNVQMEVEGGKKIAFNSFDVADQATFKQAKEKNLALIVELEKNDKGYDNLKSVMFQDANQPPVIVPSEPQLSAPGVTLQKDIPIIKEFNHQDVITRQVCLSYAKDLCVGKIIDVTQINMMADKFLAYVTSGKLS